MDIYAIYSKGSFSHRDCLLLIAADSEEDAISETLDRTDIDYVFDEENLMATKMYGLQADDAYIHIFADDIQVV